ncbi:30S ribosomal protein S7 [Candidatus Uhrbacteria bacterium CG_4_9_14_3_um_filter_36_7]|uniref:Small ribosomal subunit protein uS7 n=1 Tax=Candidatus Uhrbacteria bacterium CG_4_9_14_3_um_filter_36_7 TaxID=1975033 RepID=A0A2M7XHL0_9BACT|nr:MAG: 30S ribosomal protein S7 [Candidatus Uhrbacteria bacterium CG_4_9_14_3_um_filter_36_7]
MRGKKAPHRDLLPDQKFSNIQVAKFINYLMQDGKKTIAKQIVYRAFEIIQEKEQKDPLETFLSAIKNVSPSLEVKSRRVGGANYQIPIPVRGERRFNLACRWILTAARGKHGSPMFERLARELLAAASNEGDAVKKRADVQKMAEANRAFAHFSK